MDKINKLKTIYAAQGCDAALITSDYNRFYVSGFTGSTGYAFITNQNAYFLTDFRYYEQVEQQCTGFILKKVEGKHTYFSILNEIIKAEGIRNVGLEGDSLTYLQWKALEENVNATFIHLHLSALRMIKSDDEIKKMKKACDIACDAFEYIVTYVKPGMTEIQVKNALESKMQELGASGTSFDTITASGARGALPHGVASQKVIEAGDFITLDYGCYYEGYCSDITRTFVIGHDYDPQIAKIYEIVKDANELCIAACKPGMKTCELDKIARDYITERGYGEYFGHGLGHGVGILVHEEPRVNWLNEQVLEPGMVITIEPGIYLPQIGGVRIEDDILITKDGCERLTRLPKDLLIVEV